MSTPPILPTESIGKDLPISDVRIQKLQGLLNEAYTSIPAGIPAGCNLAILQDGGRCLLEPMILHTPNMAPDAISHWGSVSKQFTGACMAKLVTDPLMGVKLDDDIRLHLDLPEFKLGSETQVVTVRDLLYMRSGLPEVTTLLPLMARDDLQVNLKDKLALLGKYPFLDFKPGTEGRYCNTNYYLLAALIERKTGSFVDYIRDQIFTPLGMECRCSVDSTCHPSIDGYEPDGHRDQMDCQAYGPVGVVGSCSDMAKWNASIDRGQWDALLESPLGVAQEEGKLLYAGGLNVGQIGDYRLICHSGGVHCFAAHYARYEHMRDSTKTFAFFLQSNFGAHGFPDGGKIIDDIAEVISGVTDIKPQSSQPLQPPELIIIDSTSMLPYIGEYKSLDLGCTYKIEAKEKDGSWVLYMYRTDEGKDAEIMDLRPFKTLDSPMVFLDPAGGRLELVNDGLVLKGSGIAPWHLTKIV